jgi:hypothetical protein
MEEYLVQPTKLQTMIQEFMATLERDMNTLIDMKILVICINFIMFFISHITLGLLVEKLPKFQEGEDTISS